MPLSAILSYVINNNKISGNFSAIHGVALLSTVSRSNWNLKMLVFVEGGKPEYPEKNPRSRDENQQQTQPTYDAEYGNRAQVILVGGECSHHCAIPAALYAPLLIPLHAHVTFCLDAAYYTLIL